MQKCVKYKFCSRELWLMYNGTAMFDLYDLYPNLEELFNSVMQNTRESTDKLLDVFLILAETEKPPGSTSVMTSTSSPIRLSCTHCLRLMISVVCVLRWLMRYRRDWAER